MAYNSKMTKRIALALALASLACQPTAALAASRDQPALDDQIRCAVLFAYVAGAQDEGEPGVDRFPPMDEPGEAFFMKTVERVKTERGVSDDKIVDYMMKQGGGLLIKVASAENQDAELDQAMAGCLPMFRQVAPDSAPGE